MYNNILDASFRGMISKLADYIKNSGAVDGKELCLKLQQIIDYLESWAEFWQMEFILTRAK